MPTLDPVQGEISEDAELGHFCVIGDGARIAAGARLGSHVVVHPGTLVGPGCVVQEPMVHTPPVRSVMR